MATNNVYKSIEDVDTESSDWHKFMLFYKIYRSISAIILLISELVIGQKFGTGWSLAYKYSQIEKEADE